MPKYIVKTDDDKNILTILIEPISNHLTIDHVKTEINLINYGNEAVRMYRHKGSITSDDFANTIGEISNLSNLIIKRAGTVIEIKLFCACLEVTSEIILNRFKNNTGFELKLSKEE